MWRGRSQKEYQKVYKPLGKVFKILVTKTYQNFMSKTTAKSKTIQIQQDFYLQIYSHSYYYI